jgi:ABC-type transport system involved in cytochrome bd biosynthesis fused ATPase/permease subunit
MYAQNGQAIDLVSASSGCKPTMMSMLEWFYDPSTDTTSILEDALQYTNSEIHLRTTDVVQQIPTVFPCSIHETISLGVGLSKSDTSVTGSEALQS